MATASANWVEISPSQFPWEREALAFIREQFPSHEPYRAWSNFEFIAHDGTVNEVDLLVVTPLGLFLVEIKSRPGVIRGDAAHWTWCQEDGKRVTADNPVRLANRKAKRLASLLKRQKALRQERLPFVDVLVFCSAPDQVLKLRGTARAHVALRDRPAKDSEPARPGILAALISREAPGLKQDVRKITKPQARALSRALDQAGVRPSQAMRRVADYQLEELLYEGPGGTYQDWRARHVSQEVIRRVRMYGGGYGVNEAERELICKAARREFQLLERLQHDGILPVEHFARHDLGAALIFRHTPGCQRLDHYLSERGRDLSVDTRLHLLRETAEAVRYAHGKGVVHRALSPQSILVRDPPAPFPGVLLLNWQTGHRLGTTTAGTHTVSATIHPDQLVEDDTLVYMAPETRSAPDVNDPRMDVFSIGALAWALFSAEPPAASVMDLDRRLAAGRGLDLSTVLDGADPALVDLVRYATHPNVADRLDSVDEVLAQLEQLEDALTSPEPETVDDPLAAGKGDQLEGGFEVVRRLGKGGSATVFLVRRDQQESVLKLANVPEYNDRLRGEFALLNELRHENIVPVEQCVEIGGLVGFTMKQAGETTLAKRIDMEGRIGLELLERFGMDLLSALRFLEREGYYHRDLKPENLGVGPVTSGGPLHLILFDFSLAKAPLDNITAGTPGYRDPFVKLRDPPRWDFYAERYAAAVTLYEMATGNRPVWGDGQSDPALVEDCTLDLRPDFFDAALRESMVRFFGKGLARDHRDRFDNAEQMLWAWREVFRDAAQPLSPSGQTEPVDQDALVAAADLRTPVAGFSLSTRARNALDRIGALTVADLLAVPLRRIQRLRGVGLKTRGEIQSLVRKLHRRFPDVEVADPEPRAVEPGGDAFASIDMLAREVGSGGGRQGTDPTPLQAYLGLESADPLRPWPTQTDVAKVGQITPAAFHGILRKARERWSRLPAVTRLRDDIVRVLDAAGGVLAIPDLTAALLASRGSVQPEPRRSRLALAALRAAVEAERLLESPRFCDRRSGERVVVTTASALAEYAARLGQAADRLAGWDPLASPGRVRDELEQVKPPEGLATLPDERCRLQLAAYMSATAAVSVRLEIYPRGMSALRALRLCHGALSISRGLTVTEIQARVRGRYPEAAPLPARPALDRLLQESGLDLTWDPAAGSGGAYRSRNQEWITLTSSGSSLTRGSADGHAGALVTPEEVDARLFERKLRHAERDGAFLVLTARTRHLEAAIAAVRQVFDVDYRSLDALFVEVLRQQADAARVNWDLVLRADAGDPDSRDWQNLQRLVTRAVPEVEARLAACDRTILLAWPGLLARYGQVEMLDRLRDRVGMPAAGLHGLWLIIPGNGHARPAIAGKPIPILDSGQVAAVPRQWTAANRNTPSKPTAT